jgi:predicted acetyltransferase
MTTDARDPHGPTSPLRCVLARVGGEATGYARYTTTASWSPVHHGGTVDVREIHAVDVASYAALWRFLINQDLMSSVNAPGRPVDDPLLHMLDDPRAVRPQLVDGVYVRLVDVGRALASRTYGGLIDVIVEVVDEFCPWNAGRWRLIGDEKGAACERTRTGAAVDLRVGVRELGAAFLGGVTLKALAASGRVEELRRDVLANVSQAFAHDPAPWLPHGF